MRRSRTAGPEDTERIEKKALEVATAQPGSLERRVLAKQLYRLRRANRRAWEKQEEAKTAMDAPRDDRKRGVTTAPYLESAAGAKLLPEDWGPEVTSYYIDLFRGRYSKEELEERVRALREVALENEARGTPRQTIPFKYMKMAWEALRRKKGKAGAPHEALVNEMLDELPDETIEQVRQAFNRRLLWRKGGAAPRTWKRLWIHCIGNVARPIALKLWRPIALIGVLQKWYDKCLLYLAEDFLAEPSSRSWGFAPGRQPAEIVHGLQDLTLKCAEWRLPLLVARGDVRKAFDSMDRGFLEQTLAEEGVPPEVAGAILEELIVELEVHVGDAVSDGVPFLQGGKQGGTSTPTLWRHYLHRAVGRRLVVLEQEGVGLTIDTVYGPQCVNHFIFADDIWLIAGSQSHMSTLLDTTTVDLTAAGLSWKEDEKMSITANTYADWSGTTWPAVCGDKTYNFERREAIECLGALLDINGDASVLVAHRLAQMEAHFWNRHKQLRLKRVPLVCRLARYTQTVRRSGLYLAGSFLLTQAIAKRITAAENALIRKIWAPRRGPQESWDEWQKRTGQGIKYMLNRMGEPTLLQEVVRAQHSWAGHLIRFPEDHVTRRIHFWKGTTWWKQFHADQMRVDPRNRTGWKHARPGTFPRWDQALWYTVGAEWETAAEDRDAWWAGRTEWAQQRLHALGYPVALVEQPMVQPPPQVMRPHAGL